MPREKVEIEPARDANGNKGWLLRVGGKALFFASLAALIAFLSTYLSL